MSEHDSTLCTGDIDCECPCGDCQKLAATKESAPQPEAPRKGAPYTAIVDSNAVEFPAAPAQAGQQEDAELHRLAKAEATAILVEAKDGGMIADWPGTERIAQGIFKVAFNHSAAQAETRDKIIAKLVEALSFSRERLGVIEEMLDEQIYPEQVKDGFDAPDGREYAVNITASQYRILGRALTSLDAALELARQAQPKGAGERKL